MKLPLGSSDWSRSVAQTPAVECHNRFFESDPCNQADQVALLARPGLKKWLTVGDGPIRGVYSQPGSFNDALFVVSANNLYKVEQDETVTDLGSLGTLSDDVSMAATDTYLFIASGGLHYYTEDDYARGTLTASGAVSAAETVVIGTTHYAFATDVLTADQDGTSANPWLVSLGASTAQALQHLFDAINATGAAGTDYGELVYANPDASAETVSDTVLTIRAIAHGTDGNSLATTETMANASWGGSVLSGGGGSGLNTVSTPDDVGIISVGVIAGYTICVVAQGYDENGRFYWIEPGETTIDALNFATAERSPDPAWNVVVSGDQFWLPGASTIEVWYLAGDPLAPFQRQQGRLFERGAWNGTVVSIGESMMLVDSTGNVWQVTDAPRIVSTPGIAQRVREAINAERSL